MQRVRAIEILSLIIVFVVPMFTWPLARCFGIQDVRWRAISLFIAVILAISILFLVPQMLVMRSTRATEGSIDFETHQLFRAYRDIVIMYFTPALLHAGIAALLTKASSRIAILQFWMFHIASMLQFTPYFLDLRFVDNPVRDYVDFHYLSLIKSLAMFLSLFSAALLFPLATWAITAKFRQAKSS